MFSPRLLAVLAVLAAVGALPTEKSSLPRPVTTITEEDVDDSPWFSFPLFGNLFAPLWRLLPSFGDIGPRIIANDDDFKVVVNVKDYKKEDLKVKIKGDFIFVQGTHEAKQDDHDVFASQFFHTYTLPTNSSSSDVTAQLTSDGFLVVDAPLNGPVTRSKDVDREVPIVETGAPYKKEESSTSPVTSTKVETTSGTVPLPSITASATESTKEETTPANHELTDNDNKIPHGNEIQP